MRWRAFPVVEVMMAGAVIGTVAALAVPYRARHAAHAWQSEAHEAVSRLRGYFLAQYGERGIYGADIADASLNPAGALPAEWNPKAHGWEGVPVSLEGAVKLRCWYAISGGGRQLLLQAQGEVPGVGPWVYGETYQDGALVLTTEVPSF